MINVMIVDDQRAARMGFALMLRKDPALTMIAQAANGREAVDAIALLEAQGKPLPDVILMDVRMPVMDGIDATGEITRRWPAVKVVILTTYDQDSYAFGALSAGASGFLLKDVRTADLCKAIHAVAAGDAILTPRVTGEVIRRAIPVNAGRADDERATLRSRFDALGPRELEIAALVADGLDNEEIADRLGIQPDSVKKTVTRILSKLDAKTRVNIAVMWYKAGLGGTL